MRGQRLMGPKSHAAPGLQRPACSAGTAMGCCSAGSAPDACPLLAACAARRYPGHAQRGQRFPHAPTPPKVAPASSARPQCTRTLPRPAASTACSVNLQRFCRGAEGGHSAAERAWTAHHTDCRAQKHAAVARCSAQAEMRCCSLQAGVKARRSPAVAGSRAPRIACMQRPCS